jgi:flagellar biosynthesis/type III secretory pathway M-ring protein FliF/YscJ
MVRTLIGPTARAVAVLPRAATPEADAVAQQALPGAITAQAAAAANHEQQIVAARALVGQDPKRVAQVVRGWVAKDE